VSGTEGLCPISGEQGWAKAQPGCAGTRLKRKTRTGDLLDIMAKESYMGLYIVIDKQ